VVIDYYGDLNRTGKWIANPYNTYSWDNISQQQAESFLHIYKFVYIRKDGDGMTDHFVVVSSKTETLNNGQVTSTTYNFFDRRNQAYGTSSLNILTRQNNMLKGAYNGEKKYTVTTVRTSSR